MSPSRSSHADDNACLAEFQHLPSGKGFNGGESALGNVRKCYKLIGIAYSNNVLRKHFIQ